MRWMIITACAAVANVLLLELYAASVLGRTPLFLPLFLAFGSTCCTIISVLLAIHSRKDPGQSCRLNVVASVFWIGLVVYNVWSFNLVLYVS